MTLTSANPTTHPDNKIIANMAASEAQELPQSAAMLAYAGALPLIVASMLVLLRPVDFGAGAREFMLLYGGVLIAFFGGVRWGIAVMRADGPTFNSLLGAAAPLLLALPILTMSGHLTRLLLILIALPALLIDDLRATRRGSGAPDWYLGVRAPLTVLMEASFAVVLVQLMMG